MMRLLDPRDWPPAWRAVAHHGWAYLPCPRCRRNRLCTVFDVSGPGDPVFEARCNRCGTLAAEEVLTWAEHVAASAGFRESEKTSRMEPVTGIIGTTSDTEKPAEIIVNGAMHRRPCDLAWHEAAHWVAADVLGLRPTRIELDGSEGCIGLADVGWAECPDAIPDGLVCTAYSLAVVFLAGPIGHYLWSVYPEPKLPGDAIGQAFMFGQPRPRWVDPARWRALALEDGPRAARLLALILRRTGSFSVPALDSAIVRCRDRARTLIREYYALIELLAVHLQQHQKLTAQQARRFVDAARLALRRRNKLKGIPAA